MANIPSPQSSRRKGSTVASCGEEHILSLARECFSTRPGGAAGVVRGLGDDAAVLSRPAGDIYQLVTIDTIVAGTHFTLTDEPERVGWKALAVNVSDIAAMGGIPTHAVVSATLPTDTRIDYVERALAGIRKAADKFGVSVVGGDTVGAGFLSLTVALWGVVEKECVCYRSGAQQGDIVAVTGSLGGSLQSGRHLDVQPRLAEARWLVKNAKPSAMMDLSDGLAIDGRRLAEASGVSLHLRAEAIPVSPGSALEGALRDGEDFELLCAFSPEKMSVEKQEDFLNEFSRPIAVIGEIAAPPPAVLLDGKKLPADGFDHFNINGRT